MTRFDARAVLDRMHETLGAFYAGDTKAPIRELFTDDIAWHVPGDNAISGDYRGINEVLGYFVRRRDHAAGSFRMHPRETLIGDCSHIGVLTDGTAFIAGGEQRWSTLGLYRLAGNRIAECWLLPLDLVAFDAVWTS